MHGVEAAERYFFEQDYFRTILGFDRSWLFLARSPERATAAGAIVVLSDGMLHYYLGGTAEVHRPRSPFKNVVDVHDRPCGRAGRPLEPRRRRQARRRAGGLQAWVRERGAAVQHARDRLRPRCVLDAERGPRGLGLLPAVPPAAGLAARRAGRALASGVALRIDLVEELRPARWSRRSGESLHSRMDVASIRRELGSSLANIPRVREGMQRIRVGGRRPASAGSSALGTKVVGRRRATGREPLEDRPRKARGPAGASRGPCRGNGLVRGILRAPRGASIFSTGAPEAQADHDRREDHRRCEQRVVEHRHLDHQVAFTRSGAR